ncbi:MAG: hypothetical protein ACPGUV_02375, partial [Polyangiales bacterium]
PRGRDNVVSVAWQALAHAFAHETEAARQALSFALRGRQPVAEAYLARAHLALATKSPQKARRDLEQALRLVPQHRRAQALLQSL